MLKTALILVPDSKGDYSSSYSIASEYARLTYGLFRRKSLTSAFSLKGEKLLDFGRSEVKCPNNNADDAKENISTENVIKQLIDKKSFSSFFCARIVFIFSDFSRFPSCDESIPSEEIFKAAADLVKNGEDFDKLKVDVIAKKDGSTTHIASENNLYNLYFINAAYDIIEILVDQLKLSRISTKNGFVVIFKEIGEVLDILIDVDMPKSFEYYNRDDLTPMIASSTNAVLASPNKKINELFEKDFRSNTLVLQQQRMLTYSNSTGLRISTIRLSTSRPIHPSYLFNKPDADDSDSFVFEIPRIAQVSPSQPGFLLKRDGECFITTALLEYSNDTEFIAFYSIISTSPELVSMSNVICAALINQNPDPKKIETAKKMLEMFPELCNNGETKIFPEMLKTLPPKRSYKMLLNLYKKIAIKFKCTKEQDELYNCIVTLIDKINNIK